MYGNVIHPPIKSDNLEDSTHVIEIIPPPELHLLIGPVITLNNELEQVWPQFQDWLKACNVKKTDYHGGSFEGNDSRALLKNINRLEELFPVTNLKTKKYSIALSALNEVVATCYGPELHPDFEKKTRKIHRGIPKLENQCNTQDTFSHASCYRILSPYRRRFRTLE